MEEQELEIMHVLWKGGSLKPSDIQERLGRPIKNSALRWQLGELLEQGHVTREKRGKAYFYSARTPEKKTFRSLSKRLERVFFSGSSLAMLGELIESAQLSPDEIKELQKIARRKGKVQPDDKSNAVRKRK